MKSHWILALGVVAMTTYLLAENTEDYDHTADFGKYHTYSWIGVNVQEPLWSARVTKAIDDELTSKGWRKVETGGDASISAVGSTHMDKRWKPGTAADLAEAGVTEVGGAPADTGTQ